MPGVNLILDEMEAEVVTAALERLLDRLRGPSARKVKAAPAAEPDEDDADDGPHYDLPLRKTSPTPVKVVHRAEPPAPVTGEQGTKNSYDMKRQGWMTTIAKLLQKGPKSFGEIGEHVDCSDPTLIDMLRKSPYFCKTGNGRMDPWTLALEGEQFLKTLAEAGK